MRSPPDSGISNAKSISTSTCAPSRCERLAEEDLHHRILGPILGRGHAAVALDAHARDDEAPVLEEAAVTNIAPELFRPQRAVAVLAKQVLVELQPQARERIGTVVGVRDAFGALDAVADEAHADMVVRALLPVFGTGRARGVAERARAREGRGGRRRRRGRRCAAGSRDGRGRPPPPPRALPRPPAPRVRRPAGRPTPAAPGPPPAEAAQPPATTAPTPPTRPAAVRGRSAAPRSSSSSQSPRHHQPARASTRPHRFLLMGWRVP